jgi:hypothetical protein
MTSYRRINSRTLNRDVQQQDNMVVFNKPISRGIYPNYFSVPDASLNSLLVSTGSPYSATASSQLTFDGTTLDVSGNLTVVGNTALHYSHVAGNLDVSGNVDVSGTILAHQYLPGQVVNVMMLSNTDLSQNAISIGGGDVSGTLFSYVYQPKIANSYILCEYQTIYKVGGNGNDYAEGFIFVSNNKISQTYQQWLGTNPGTGTRSGTIFPIVGRYTNANLTAKTIRVDVHTSTDQIDISADNSTWLKITEFGR